MPIEQSIPKADTTATLPGAGPDDLDTNPDGYLPIPIWVCHCDHYEPAPSWYRRLTDRVAGWFPFDTPDGHLRDMSRDT